MKWQQRRKGEFELQKWQRRENTNMAKASCSIRELKGLKFRLSRTNAPLCPPKMVQVRWVFSLVISKWVFTFQIKLWEIPDEEVKGLSTALCELPAQHVSIEPNCSLWCFYLCFVWHVTKMFLRCFFFFTFFVKGRVENVLFHPSASEVSLI